MIPKHITESIYYIGVNDRSTEHFEAMWPLPYGVSYNSYLVRGSEKSAVIDSVELGHSRDFIADILEANGGREPDYLVVNHMEPDHSGGIPRMLEAFPALKIVGNRLTVPMIKGFYHVEDDSRFVIVADDEELSLGDLTLRFCLTPMVHWPETMMTYCPERKVLFSGDAFGCFGALDGAVVDTQTDTERYLPEMYRYYSCIVAKYGQHVQRAFARVGSLEMDYICSTHGPVWHAEIPRVMDIYRRLSSWQSEEGVVIIYGSMYGNTEDAAELIARRLADNGVRNIRVHNASRNDLDRMITDCVRYRDIIIGSPTYSMTIYPPVEQLLQALVTREVKNKRLALFGSYTWAQGALKKMEQYAEQMKLTPVATAVIKQSLDAESTEGCLRLADQFI